jgi:membrane protein YdbS with pleckstrin-like domain
MTQTTPQLDLRLRDPAHHVSSRAKTFWTVRALVPWLVIIAAEIVIIVLIAVVNDGNPKAQHGVHVSTTIFSILLAVSCVVGGAHLIVMPRWRYRVHLWEVTDTAVYAQSGWLTQERRIAPLSRVQTVDVERGPLEQLFKLANVTVTTASAAGPIKIHGLDSHTADDIVSRLTIATAASTGDAT